MTKKTKSKKRKSPKHRYSAVFDVDDFLFLRAVAISESTPEKPVSVQTVLNEMIRRERKRKKNITITHVTEKE